MKSALRPFGQTAIILFVLWHCYAVAIYTVPRDAKDRFSQWIISELMPDVTPYMLITSQWQLWNLFSPDPLRRVTFYHVEIVRDGRWQTIESIDADRYSVWRHAVRFKMLGNLFKSSTNDRTALAERFLELKCAEFGLARDVPIRLVYEDYVIPRHETRASRSWWNAWRPSPERTVAFNVFCP